MLHWADLQVQEKFNSTAGIKMNFIDRVIGFINPEAGLKRMQSRVAMESMRDYNAASRGRRRLTSNRTNASYEVSKAADYLSGVSQHLVRNNPLAQRIKLILASNIVGSGINADITSSSKRTQTDFSREFDAWANSKVCDFDGHNNLNGLLWLIAATVVESGGCFVRFHYNRSMKFPLQLQLIEQIYLDKTKDQIFDNSGGMIKNGIQYNSLGQIEGYHIDIDPSGTNTVTAADNTRYYKKDEDIIHIFRRERPGQHLGVSWMAQIATHLERYDGLQDAKIMQQRIAACLGVFIHGDEKKLGDDTEHPMVDKVEPGLVQYVGHDTQISVVNPPKADDGHNFTVELKSDMASGVGLNYQQLTGDYSKFNFASGKMGLMEFNIFLDTIQKHMIKPALEEIEKQFIKAYRAKTGRNSELEVQWIKKKSLKLKL